MRAGSRELLNRLRRVEPKVVSVGAMTVRLFTDDEIDAEQVGYSRDSVGADLAGEEYGQWRSEWVVIGREDLCGDPIFVDTSDRDLPVFTAVHGLGTWTPELLATSLAGFMLVLKKIAELSVGRSCPVDLNANPLSEVERADLLNSLSCLGANANRQFWIDWFELAG